MDNLVRACYTLLLSITTGLKELDTLLTLTGNVEIMVDLAAACSHSFRTFPHFYVLQAIKPTIT